MDLSLGNMALGAPTSWWSSGTTFSADFINNRYMSAGSITSQETAFSFTRATQAYGDNLVGDWSSFGIDEPRITNKGLRIEPEKQDLTLNGAQVANWITLNSAMVPDASGPHLGLFQSPQTITNLTGVSSARARTSNNGSVVISGQEYACTFWFRPGNSGRAGIYCTGNAGTSSLIFNLPSFSVLSSSNSRGSMTLIAARLVAGDIYEITVTWVPNFSGGSDLGAGSGSATIGETIVGLGAKIEPGNIHTSPGVGNGSIYTRAADQLTLHLPPNSHDLTFTFSDDSTQIITGCSGDYLVPSALDGAVVTGVVG